MSECVHTLHFQQRTAVLCSILWLLAQAQCGDTTWGTRPFRPAVAILNGQYVAHVVRGSHRQMSRKLTTYPSWDHNLLNPQRSRFFYMFPSVLYCWKGGKMMLARLSGQSVSERHMRIPFLAMQQPSLPLHCFRDFCTPLSHPFSFLFPPFLNARFRIIFPLYKFPLHKFPSFTFPPTHSSLASSFYKGLLVLPRRHPWMIAS